MSLCFSQLDRPAGKMKAGNQLFISSGFSSLARLSVLSHSQLVIRGILLAKLGFRPVSELYLL